MQENPIHVILMVKIQTYGCKPAIYAYIILKCFTIFIIINHWLSHIDEREYLFVYVCWNISYIANFHVSTSGCTAAEEMEAIFLSVCNDDDREVVLEPARRFYTVIWCYILFFLLVHSWLYTIMFDSFCLSWLKIAVERNFTRGRERDLVGAACLYVACR